MGPSSGNAVTEALKRSAESRLKAEAIRRDLRVQAKSFCVFADACPHISRIECAKCFRYFANIEEHRVE